MKYLLTLLLTLTFAVCHGQDEGDPDDSTPGWLNSPAPQIPAFSVENTPQNLEGGCVGGYAGGASNIAEAITPEIEALARGLGNDPLRIYNYVHDHIRQVFYFGSKKGAHLTLLERSGNDFDQSALLVALLRAAGYSAASQFGFLTMPWSSPAQIDIQHWLQLQLTNTTQLSVSNYLFQYLGVRGFPLFVNSMVLHTNDYTFQRVWVKLNIGGTNYYLDPGFKLTEPISGIDLAAASGLDTNALVSAAGGATGANSIQGLDEPAVRNKLRDYTTNLLAYLQSNYPNASVEDMTSGWRIVPSTNLWFSQAQPFTVWVYDGSDCVMDWDNQPTNFMSRLTITLAGTNYSLPLPSLQGKRLTLTFSNGMATLWQDETLLLQRTTTGNRITTNVVCNIHQPFGWWDYINNVFHDQGYQSDSATNAYQRTNATYTLVYGFEVGSERLKARQNQLDFYRQQGAGGTNWAVAETLNLMGISWMEQVELITRLLAKQTDASHMHHHLLGRMAQEAGKGYYIDFLLFRYSDVPNRGWTSADWQKTGRMADVRTYFASGLEHGIIEQLQATNLVAASSIKVLQVANTNNIVVYLANSSSWANIRDKHLINYSSADKSRLNKYISGGYVLLLPKNGAISASGTGGWTGYGIIGRMAGGLTAGMIMEVSGGYQGGFVSDPLATVDDQYVGSVIVDQPAYLDPTGPFLTVSYSKEPVRLSDGAFVMDAADLSIGQAEPRGITFTRHYSSARRYQNPAGLASGWTHNYFFKLAEVSAPEAGLGRTTPAQMASMLVATRAAFDLYQTNTDPKNWLLTALVAKWGIDQLIKNAVSATLGDDIVQFVAQPDGGFTPPANCPMTLAKSSSAYQLSQRHGNTFKFDSSGKLTNIVDQYGQALKLAYNSSNWVTTITDWKNRVLTLTYSGTPLRLASVSDSSGRSVSYGYTTAYNSQGDLSSVTDPESQASTFIYDANHQIIATKDALNRSVVSNAYDGFGRVVEQYSQGDTNKTWRFYWSGFVNTEQDSAGARRYFFFDEKSRQIAEQDALGHMTQRFYDGQDHVIATVSPLNEVHTFAFDGRHNLVRSIDPLGFTNQFFDDGQNNLYRTIDARGQPNNFGYNAKFQLVGSTNGAANWQTFAYNSTDGTLTSRTDAGGTTTYGYDAWGQLTGITHPNGLGSEGLLNNAVGDVLSRTNGLGFVTSFQYNARRQLTNTIAPTNLIAKVTYDAVGNAQSSTDPRGFTTTHFWSATGKPLGAARPTTPQGVPATTNIYDARDWLARSLNPLQQATLVTNDVAGRLVSSTDPLLRSVRFGYDANGRRTFTTNAALEVTRQQWSARGEAIALTDGATNTSLRGYDAAGNQVILTNRNGKRWQFQFDAANRLTNTLTPLNRGTLVTLDERGLVKNVREPSGQTVTNYYDARGRLTNFSDSVSTVLSTYDANNNRTALFEAGKSNVWTFDAYDRVTSYRDTDGNLIQYRSDANGNVTNLVYPGGKNVCYAYDGLNRLTNVTDWASRKTSFEYDLASRLRKITRPNGTTRTMDYDAAGEATNLWEKTSSGVPIAVFKLNWNAAARMEWEYAAPPPHPWTAPTRTMTYDDDNRLATFNSQSVTHDLDGNMTSGPLTNNTLTNYTYDARNRLLSAGGISCGYDAMGNRIALTNGTNITRFVINPSTALSQVLVRVRNGVTNYYVYGMGLLYEADDAGSTKTYHYDYRGSTVALTDSSGDVTDRAEYSAYGTLTYRTGSTDTPFLYNGRYGVQTDPDGLLYMRARYYNPYLGRFVNPDPSGFAGGLNWYAYADGNPVSLLDPRGLQSWIDFRSLPNYSGPSTFPSSSSSPTPLPAAYTASNPTGHGVILFDSGISAFVGVGGGAGTQTILLENGQIVSYGYVGGGIGLGGGGGAFGLGEVFGVYKPTDYNGAFLNVSGGVGGVASVSSQPLPGQDGAASYSAGAGTKGISATFQWYWIIDATGPLSGQSPNPAPPNPATSPNWNALNASSTGK